VSTFVPLKRRAHVQYGLGQPPQLSDDGVPIIRATNIFRGRIAANGFIRARVEDLPLKRAPLLQPGEVLVVRSGAYTGDSALITPEWAGAAPGYDLRITPGRQLEPRFMAYTMLGQRAMDQIDLAKSRAAQPHLNAEDLGEVDVLDTPVSAQRAIADYLDRETARIDALMAAKRQMVELLDERWQEVLDTVIWSDIGRTTRVMHVVDLRRQVMYGIVLPGPDVGDDGIPIVKGGDVAQRRLSWNALCKTTPEIEAPYARARLRGGDLVFAIRGGIGDVAVVPEELTGANITQDVARVAPQPGIISEWLMYALQSPTTQRDVRRRVTGATITGLNIWELERVEIPMASLERQQRDLRQLRSEAGHLHKMRGALDRQVALLQERRQALITAAVTGQLEIAEAA
jgi:type I restriction enzyme S subunit